MTKEELQNNVKKAAERFGYKIKDSESGKGNVIFRSNLNDPQGANFFGFIRPEEPLSGAYSDFSLVIFPSSEDSTFFVSLGIGSQGFTNDYELASLPGLRRKFLSLIKKNDSFCKPSFTDTESQSRDFVKFIKDSHKEFKPIVKKYGKCLPIIQYLDSGIEGDLKILYGWIAQYASIRGLPSNDQAKKDITAAINDAVNCSTGKKVDEKVDENEGIKNLLNARRFVVLQGAPGTGKTFTANELAKGYERENIFFEQFHAETSYSDFVYGIEPDINNPGQFKVKEGILYKAIKQAQNVAQKKERVLLIIDEINRANLANVLGPVFYLFENGTEERRGQVQIGNITISRLPDNLDVIATMNTADRSLAVVDFALRRRFSWYTLRPKILDATAVPTDKVFDTNLFNSIADIFTWYASDEELNLQPGQSYFIFNKNNNNDRCNRIIYELMPLIKEYISEGYLTKARESFSNLFNQEVQRQLFE